MKFTWRPAGLPPFLDVFPILRELHDAVVAVVVVTIGNEDVAAWCDRNIAGRVEMIRSAAGFSGRAECHQHFPFGTERDHLMPSLVALGDPVRGDRVRHPDVAVLVDVKAMRPDEHAAAKTPDDVSVVIEQIDRVRLRIPALVTEPRL